MCLKGMHACLAGSRLDQTFDHVEGTVVVVVVVVVVVDVVIFHADTDARRRVGLPWLPLFREFEQAGGKQPWLGAERVQTGRLDEWAGAI